MPNREKVIKAAEICLRYIDNEDCPTECPYFDLCTKYEKRVVFQPLIRDALALLKEQEAVEPYIAGSGESFETAETWWYECGNCNKPIDPNDKFCRHCGQAVKWE